MFWLLSFGKGQESFTSIHGSPSLLLWFVVFLLFSFNTGAVYGIYIPRAFISLCCKGWPFQLPLFLLISNDGDIAPTLSKVTLKGKLPEVILSAFFSLQNKSMFLKLNSKFFFYGKADLLQISLVCVPCVFSALVGTGVWYLQSLSCVCLLGDEYSSLTCVCPIPFLSTYRCTPTQWL